MLNLFSSSYQKNEQFLLDSIFSSSSSSTSSSSSWETFNPIKKERKSLWEPNIYIYIVAMPLNEPIVHFTQTRFNGISKSFCLPFISLPFFSLSFFLGETFICALTLSFFRFLLYLRLLLRLLVRSLLLSHINTNNINMTIR